MSELGAQISAQWGVSLWILVIILIWSVIWKLLALWKSARKNHITWFILLALINTVGILEILYIYVFSEIKFDKKPKKKEKKKK
jgi:methionyl-tRNA synthetase